MRTKILIIIIVLGLSLLYSYNGSSKDPSMLYKHRIEKNIYVQKPEPISDFTFDELIELSRSAQVESRLKAKLDSHLSMVYVVNRNNNSTLEKPYVRITEWNIKRGFNIDAIKEAITDSNSYEKKYVSGISDKNKKKLKEELINFSNSDILCLNEVDIGMPRTKYNNVVSELADSLNWDYAYATEFVEVGPLFLKQKVDKTLYKGLHGNAIISKYPIVSAEVIRLPNHYDWYKEEAQKRQSPLEHFRKLGAKAIFRQYIESHEVRHGGRNAIVADIKIPNNQILTVVLSHLEDRAYPDERFNQFNFLLSKIKNKKTPLVLTGDFNTSTTDTKPTSMQKEVEKRIRDPHFFLRQAAFMPVPFVPIAGGIAAVAFSKLLQYKDPFFPSIPVLFPNHERKFFTHLKKFKFDDGFGFDLTGNKKRSSNHKRGLLANSNQRHWKGFKSTYKLEEPRIIAYFKLDWFFVKPLGNNFRPFNGRTLRALNYSLKDHISDHNPISVDLNL